MKSSGDGTDLSIGEIAGRFDLPSHVLRHWESVGLLAPTRAVAGRRRYGSEHLYRIAAILRAKEAGFSLEDIHAVIEADDPAQRRRILRRHRADLARRITQAQASLRIIDAALGCRHDDFTRCPDYRAALADRAGAPADTGDPAHHHACPP